MALEEECDTEISDEQAEKIRTVRDVLNYINNISGEEDVIMETRQDFGQEGFGKFLNEALRMKNEYEQAKVNCGIIGMSGSGKSSLINAIAGEKVAEVGSTEQTMEPQKFFPWWNNLCGFARLWDKQMATKDLCPRFEAALL